MDKQILQNQIRTDRLMIEDSRRAGYYKDNVEELLLDEQKVMDKTELWRLLPDK